MGNDTSEWREKVAAAHDMVSALCLPRGSKGSCEWIMRIPADPENDPDLVITSGLVAAEKRIAELEAELAARPAHEAPADLHSASDGEWIGDPEPNADDVAAVYDASTATFGNKLYEMIKNTPQPTRRERRIMMAHCIAMWKAYHNALSIPTPADLPSEEDLGVMLRARWKPTDAWTDTAKNALAVLAPWMRSRHIDAEELERLAASGALVPVPDGEPCSAYSLRIGNILTCDHDGVWQVMGGNWVNSEAWVSVRNLSTGEDTELLHSAMVQPIRLVPLEEFD